MENEPPSTPEMWLLFLVGFGSGMISIALALVFGTEPLTANALLGLGFGLIGLAILGYLWKTRENYKDALVGD